MRGEDFDFISNFGTLWQVFFGAILATAGGFAGTQMEWFLERRRRERQAALMFGEVLSTLGVILSIAHRTHGIGDPFGPITMRMLRSAQREIEIYERNRETLYDLTDAGLRARIHTLVLRINTPIEGVFDAHDEIALGEAQLRKPDFPPSSRTEMQARVERLSFNRAGSYDSAIEAAGDIGQILKQLEPFAGHSFRTIESAVAEAARFGPPIPATSGTSTLS